MARVIGGGGGKPKKKPLPTPPISPLPLPQISPDRLPAVGPPGPPPDRLQIARDQVRFLQEVARVEAAKLPQGPILRADPRRGRGFNRAITPLPTGQLPGIPGLALPGGEQAANIIRGAVTGVGFDPAPAPTITTPQSPFALEEQLFHDISQHVVKRIFEALDTGNRNRLPGQITDVIAALLPWREWGFGSYQEALRSLGYTEIPGAGTWIKDEEIISPAGVSAGVSAVGGVGGTNTQFVTQRAGFTGGGGGFRSPQFSTLINWRI